MARIRFHTDPTAPIGSPRVVIQVAHKADSKGYLWRNASGPEVEDLAVNGLIVDADFIEPNGKAIVR